EMASYASVPLTTVHVPQRQMGRRATEILIRHIEALDAGTIEKLILVAKIIERATTRALEVEASADIAVNAGGGERTGCRPRSVLRLLCSRNGQIHDHIPHIAMGSRPGIEREAGSVPSASPRAIREDTRDRDTVTLGVIVGNRGFFPHHLCESGRRTILDVLEREGIRAVITPEQVTNNGAIESLQEARLCADLFRSHRDEIDGILVTLPNFGDERAIANTIRWADLNVPVLVHAFQDAADQMTIVSRRD